MFNKSLAEGMAGDNAGILLRGAAKRWNSTEDKCCQTKSVTPHTEFTAEVYILKKEEGGRHTPFFSDISHSFTSNDRCDWRCDSKRGVEMVMPGDTVTFKVKLVAPVALEEKDSDLRFVRG